MKLLWSEKLVQWIKWYHFCLTMSNITETYLEPYQTPIMRCFCKNSWWFLLGYFHKNFVIIISSNMFDKALSMPLNHLSPKNRIAISIMILAKWTTIILHESVFLLIDKLLIWIKLQLFWKYFEISKITSGELYFCGRSVVFLKTYSTDALNSLSTR